MVEAPESARDDNARRDRIALCGGAAMSAAYHQAYIEEYDTAQLEIVAVRLAQLAQCTCDDGRQPSRESGIGRSSQTSPLQPVMPCAHNPRPPAAMPAGTWALS